MLGRKILKNSLFGTTNIIKNSDKEKCVYSGYGIALNGAGSRNFGNNFVRYVAIFGVGNTSSHAHNCKNNFLVISEGPTFSKTNTKFCLSLHYNGGNSYLFVNGKEIFKFKAEIKSVNFPTQFS